jgi:hypothetical protein
MGIAALSTFITASEILPYSWKCLAGTKAPIYGQDMASSI